MKNRIIKTCFLSLCLSAFFMNEADAQRSGRRRTEGNTTPPPAGQTQQQEQNNDTRPPSGYNPYGNIPVVVDSAGMSDTMIRKSMRNDAAFDKSAINDRTPLPYEHLRWDDALFTERVWRELDLREK